jgi:8-oxo-dGTP pyrophosphatase MutT (NUDIX family)
MGAGVLPTTIHNGKLYFLFGKEGKYEDSAPGFSDFGGGTDHKETFFKTAIREAGEEFTGFLGSDTEVKKLLTKNKTYNIDYTSNTNHGTYRMHIFPFEYNEWLPLYYNNNQQFLQKHLSPEVFKKNKIFEKAEINWICVDDIKRMRPKFRSYFQNIVDMILAQKEDIISFIKKRRIHPKNTKKKRLSSNKTRRIQK